MQENPSTDLCDLPATDPANDIKKTNHLPSSPEAIDMPENKTAAAQTSDNSTVKPRKIVRINKKNSQTVQKKPFQAKDAKIVAKREGQKSPITKTIAQSPPAAPTESAPASPARSEYGTLIGIVALRQQYIVISIFQPSAKNMRVCLRIHLHVCCSLQRLMWKTSRLWCIPRLVLRV